MPNCSYRKSRGFSNSVLFKRVDNGWRTGSILSWRRQCISLCGDGSSLPRSSLVPSSWEVCNELYLPLKPQTQWWAPNTPGPIAPNWNLGQGALALAQKWARCIHGSTYAALHLETGDGIRWPECSYLSEVLRGEMRNICSSFPQGTGLLQVLRRIGCSPFWLEVKMSK